MRLRYELFAIITHPNPYTNTNPGLNQVRALRHHHAPGPHGGRRALRGLGQEEQGDAACNHRQWRLQPIISRGCNSHAVKATRALGRVGGAWRGMAGQGGAWRARHAESATCLGGGPQLAASGRLRPEAPRPGRPRALGGWGLPRRAPQPRRPEAAGPPALPPRAHAHACHMHMHMHMHMSACAAVSVCRRRSCCGWRRPCDVA